MCRGGASLDVEEDAARTGAVREFTAQGSEALDPLAFEFEDRFARDGHPQAHLAFAPRSDSGVGEAGTARQQTGSGRQREGDAEDAVGDGMGPDAALCSAANLELPALFVGDSRYDHEAAQRAGLQFVFVHGWSEFQGWQAYCATHQIRIIEKLADLRAILTGQIR